MTQAAIAYLQRFPASERRVREVLRRRFRRLAAPAPADPVLSAWIDEAVVVARRSGLLDDAAYASALVQSLWQRGTSLRAMDARLRARGLAEDDRRRAMQALQEDARERTDDLVSPSAGAAHDLDLAAARRWLERKRIGRFARAGEPGDAPPPEGAWEQKALRALARAGFSYDVARRALAQPSDT